MGLLPEEGHACSTSKRQALGNGNHAKKTKLFVNSRHRELNDTNRVSVNDYEWVPETPLRHVKNIRVEYAEIPTSFTNVLAGENTFQLEVTKRFAHHDNHHPGHTQVYDLVVPQGYYTQEALVAALNTAAAGISLPTGPNDQDSETPSWVQRTADFPGENLPPENRVRYLGGAQEVSADGTIYRSTGLIHFGIHQTTHQIYIQLNSFKEPDPWPIGGIDGNINTAVPNFYLTLRRDRISHVFGFTNDDTVMDQHHVMGNTTSHASPVEGVTSTLAFGAVPRLAAYTVIYLTCKELGKSEFERVVWGKNCPRSVYPVLARFQMKAGINYMNFFINEFGLQNYQFTYHDITTIEKFTFMWVDDNGKEVNFHGYDHSFTLSVTHGT